VVVVGDRCQQDRALHPASAGHAWPKSSDDAQGSRGCHMLVSDRDVSLMPPSTDAYHCWRHQIEVHLLRVGSRCQCVLEELIGPVLVTGEQAFLDERGKQVLTGRRLGRPRLERGEVVLEHPPLSRIFDGWESTGSYISIRRHVMDTQSVRHIDERDRVGHQPASTSSSNSEASPVREAFLPISATARRDGLRGG